MDTPMPIATQQKDIFRDSPQAEAARLRVCAQTARVDPYFTPGEQARRAAYYTQQAETLERSIASKGATP